MERLHTKVQDCDKARLDSRVLYVLSVSQKGDAYLHDLFALLGRDDVRNVLCDELEVVDDILEEILRQALERNGLLLGQR